MLLEEENEEIQTDRFVERLMTYLQRSTSKQNGIKAIQSTYLTIMNILKKVSLFVGNFYLYH